MHRSALALGLVVFLAASASACSSTTTPAGGTAGDSGSATSGGPSTSAKAPCQLLPRADAEATVGQPLPENAEDKTLGSCQWTTADFAAGASVTVSSWDAIKTAETSHNEKPVPVAGVGDEAYSNGPDLFFVRRGTDGFLLMLNGPGIDKSDQGLAQYKALAVKILANF